MISFLFLLACQSPPTANSQQEMVVKQFAQLAQSAENLEQSAFELESQIDILRRATTDDQDEQMQQLLKKWQVLETQHQEIIAQMNDLRALLKNEQPVEDSPPKSQNVSQ